MLSSSLKGQAMKSIYKESEYFWGIIIIILTAKSRASNDCKIYHKLSGENKLTRQIWITFITILVVLMSIDIKANEVNHKTKRVPAEFEPQEAVSYTHLTLPTKRIV